MINIDFISEIKIAKRNVNSNLNYLKGLKISSQNINSFNLSTAEMDNLNLRTYEHKLTSIVKSRHDIILIQDCRIGHRTEKIIKDLSLTQFGSYEVFINSSSSSSRGVAILINKAVNYEVFKVIKSNCNNLIVLDMLLKGCNITIGCVYGPKQQNHRGFYTQVRSIITDQGNQNFIIGGDYNAINSIEPPSQNPLFGNIDLYLTETIPNINNSMDIVEWISRGEAVDPFRFLNPNSREFSYISFNDNHLSQSRIDFFLCNYELMNVIQNVNHHIRTKKFDHKEVVIEFKPIDMCRKEKKIDNGLLDLEGLEETVKFEFMGTCLDHFDLPNKEHLKNRYSQISIMNHRLNCLLVYQKANSDDIFITYVIENLKQNIEDFCNEFPPLMEILSSECNITADCFLETILNTMKIATINFQTFYKKERKREKISLIRESNLIRGDSASEENGIKLKTIENTLKRLEDNENQQILSNSKQWALINNEKPNKPFANLLKRSNANDDLMQVQHEGKPFKSKDELGDFLSDHFGNFYKKISREGGVNLENFLGEDLYNPLIQTKILNEQESQSINGPILVEELDEVLDSINMNSSPGLDGISNKFLKKFWFFLRFPMTLAFNIMLENMELKGLMKNSKIRLIPKGEALLTEIKSWRPISLLTSPYKIFSGVISLRMKKVMDKIKSKCQKAYSNTSFIHEGLINVYETMQKAITQNETLSAMIIDFSKAFDSLHHEYIYEVLNFFNFGDTFIKMVKTCFFNRQACIINGGGYTKNFAIDSGTMQGDLPSPDIFTTAIEPLLVKLLLNAFVTLPALTYSLKENDPAPDEAGAFADDMNLMTKACPNTIVEIKRIFDNFGKVSGLHMNTGKTKIITVGPEPSNEFIEKIQELGFKRDDKFKLLGITFDHKLELMDENWDRVLKKIEKIKNFWAMFHLSIPGRITVAKTFMLSQVCYVGTILDPSEEVMANIEKIILNFVTHKNNFAKSKVFRPTAEGGMGLFKIRDFIDGLRVGIFKKSLTNNDTWAHELHAHRLSTDNQFFFNVGTVDTAVNPVIKVILESYDRFSNAYWQSRGNILFCRVFNNPNFRTSDMGSINQNFFNPRTWERDGYKIKTLRLKDCIGANNRPLTHLLFNEMNETGLNFMEYMRFSSVIANSLKKFSTNIFQEGACISQVITKVKKGSSVYRKYITAATLPKADMKTATNRYIWSGEGGDINVCTTAEKEFCNTWNQNFLSNDIRDFSFKFIHNLLKLNAAIAHFGIIESPRCTFCSLNRVMVIEKETLRHFFQSCEITQSIALLFFNSFLMGHGIDFNIKWLFRGAPAFLKKYEIKIINNEILVFLFLLYKYRHYRKLPLIINIEYFFEWNRVLWLKNSSYRYAWVKWKRDEGGGDRRDQRVQIINDQNG